MDEVPRSETPFPSKARSIRWAVLLIATVFLAGSYLTLKNLRDTLETQATDRLTRAISHISNENLEVRLGGIHALGRIAANSEKDYWPIIEILAAYVREHAAVKKSQSLKETPRQLALDVQAALDVIGRRKRTYKDGETQRLDLRGTDLRRANLAGAKFAGAILSEARLEGANLTGVRLEDAILREAHLDHANLTEAALERSFLLNASLKEAHLGAANLREAYVGGTRFDEADLLGADLTGAVNLTWDQIRTAKKDNRTRLPDYLRLPAPAPGAR